MNHKTFKFIGLGLAVAMMAVVSRSANALTLVPPTLEFSAQPGQTLKQDIKLYNEGNDPLILYASTANFSAKDELGEPDFKFDQAPEDLASWIVVPKDPITLAPKATEKVSITINVPNDADPGGHYSGVFFSTSPSGEAGGGQVKVLSKIGTLVILRVEGDVREAANVAAFSVEGNASTSNLPVTFLLRVNNTGNVHVRPKGFVTVRNMFGGVTATLPINPKEGAVLPNSIRRYDIVWKKTDAEASTGGFFSQIGSEWRNFALGTYTAELVGTYGQSNQTLTASTRVTVVPWQLLTVIGLGLVVLVVLIVWLVKAYNTMIIARAQRSMTSGSGKSSDKKQ